MSKGMAIKDAIKAWEDKHQKVAAEATVVKLFMSQPLIVKMDASLATLAKVELPCLRILSLGRNNIKKIEGLDAVADTLEELWVSYNQIEKLNGVECCKKLKILYASNNKIKAWDGVTPAQALPVLEDLLLVGNPIEEKCTADGNWVQEVSKKFPVLKKLDGRMIIREDAMGDDEEKAE
ncbi:hypothetical protein HK105_200003 [Polyrhizophydium stewartii]|uniref:Dynein light chain 1, axonemal n=1 Tax=Polyrhizophydium stewartii TaxID=2732419 RepID=A0ABR4NK88_9FUNG